MAATLDIASPITRAICVDPGLVEALVQKQLERLGRLHVLLAEDAIVGSRLGQAGEPPDPQHQLRRKLGPLLDLPGRQLAAQDPLDGQQRQPVFRHRGLELAELDPVLGQPLEQPFAGGAILALQAVQQSCAFEVHPGILSHGSGVR